MVGDLGGAQADVVDLQLHSVGDAAQIAHANDVVKRLELGL